LTFGRNTASVFKIKEKSKQIKSKQQEDYKSVPDHSTVFLLALSSILRTKITDSSETSVNSTYYRALAFGMFPFVSCHLFHFIIPVII
jgi:hypothetical protein